MGNQCNIQFQFTFGSCVYFLFLHHVFPARGSSLVPDSYELYPFMGYDPSRWPSAGFEACSSTVWYGEARLCFQAKPARAVEESSGAREPRRSECNGKKVRRRCCFSVMVSISALTILFYFDRVRAACIVFPSRLSFLTPAVSTCRLLGASS
jgi:hypothetical protein